MEDTGGQAAVGGPQGGAMHGQQVPDPRPAAAPGDSDSGTSSSGSNVVVGGLKKLKKPLPRMQAIALLKQVQAQGLHIAGHGCKMQKLAEVVTKLKSSPEFAGFNLTAPTIQQRFETMLQEHKTNTAQNAVEHRSGTDDEVTDEVVQLLDGILGEVKDWEAAKQKVADEKAGKVNKQERQAVEVREAAFTSAPKRRKQGGRSVGQGVDSHSVRSSSDSDGGSPGGARPPTLEGALSRFLVGNTPDARQVQQELDLRAKDQDLRRQELQNAKDAQENQHRALMAMMEFMKTNMQQGQQQQGPGQH